MLVVVAMLVLVLVDALEDREHNDVPSIPRGARAKLTQLAAASKTVGSSGPRNAVFTVAFGYRYFIHRRFVLSLRESGFTGMLHDYYRRPQLTHIEVPSATDPPKNTHPPRVGDLVMVVDTVTAKNATIMNFLREQQVIVEDVTKSLSVPDVRLTRFWLS